MDAAVAVHDHDVDTETLRYWQVEQHKMASQVIVPPQQSFATTAPAGQHQQQVAARGGDEHCYYTTFLSYYEEKKECLLIGGVDVSYFPPSPENDDESERKSSAIAVYVILKYEATSACISTTTSSSDDNQQQQRQLQHQIVPKVIHRSHKYYQTTTPYIPSYLAYREIDPIIELITNQIHSQPHFTPHVIMVDGNGQWHDRYAGLACFVGVKTGIPTIGVGKTFYTLDADGHNSKNSGNWEDHCGHDDLTSMKMKKNDITRDVKRGVQCWYDDYIVHRHHRYSKMQQRVGPLSSPEIKDMNKRCVRGLIVDNKSIPYTRSCSGYDERESEAQSLHPQVATTTTNETTSIKSSCCFEDMLRELHRVSTGLAIPMRGGCGGCMSDKNNDEKVLAFALIGHGGNENMHTINCRSISCNHNNSEMMKKNSTRRGSKNPIYISCGSHISLLDAVSLVAYTSIVRIPEPIREADLHGRRLLREEKNRTSN